MNLESILKGIERTVTGFCLVSAWILLPLLVLMRVFDIVARQFFNSPSTLIQVLEWRAFLVFVLLSFGFAYLRDAHIRVDILRNRQSPTVQAWLEVTGFLFAMVPFAFVVIWYGSDYALQSYLEGEREAIALGLPVKWVVKGMLPFGIGLLFLAGLVGFIRNMQFLLGASVAADSD